MYSILVVEDDDLIRNNLKNILFAEGFKVLLAENGIEAYKIALKNIPNLIISDIQMPQMDGIELLKKLKSNPNTASIKFIFLTAEADLQKRRTGISIGAKEYITKPFDLNYLLEKIYTALEDDSVSLKKMDS